jgi:hypothetical protein
MAENDNTPVKTGLKRDLPYSPSYISPSVKNKKNR